MRGTSPASTRLSAPAIASAVAAATAAAASRRPLVGFVDAQRASPELATVEALHRRGRAVRVRHLDECEPARTTGLAVHDHGDRLDLAVLLEGLSQLGLGGGERKIPNITLLAQARFPIGDHRRAYTLWKSPRLSGPWSERPAAGARVKYARTSRRCRQAHMDGRQAGLARGLRIDQRERPESG